MNKKTVSSLQRVLNTWGVVVIIWSIYRTKVLMPEWFDEIIAKPLVFILPTYLYIKNIEKKPYLSQIWLLKDKFLSDLSISIVLGFIFMISALLANYLRVGNLNFLNNLFSENLLIGMGITLITAVSEEVLSRGFILKRIYEDSKNKYSASFLASILFLILHFPILLTNHSLSGSLILMLLGMDFVLSLVNSFVFLDRKSLLAPILIHTFYNLAILLYI